jgi:hypothetical protein
MRIHRSHPDDHFTIIPNETLRDQRLSYNARGVLMELLSHVDGWETNADALSQLARRRRGERPGEGRRALRSVFAELEELGYLVRRKERREGGRFVTTLDLFDTPGHRDMASGISVDDRDPWASDHRGTGSGTSVDGMSVDGMSVDGMSVDGTSATGTSTRSTNLRSTKEEELSEEDSTSLAGARAAAADAAARDHEAELQARYETVRRLSDADLRDAMLAFERKRPRIFRECRRDALAQLEAKDKKALKVGGANVGVDRLSYMYALRHYAPDWPAWLLRPLPDPRQLRAA